MDTADEVWVILAQRAGLDLALAEFREDVAAAAKTAAAASAGIGAPADVRAEAWPPMRMDTRA